MNAQPLLTDLPATRLIARPGDRMLARVGFELTKDQAARITRSIIKFAGSDVIVLVVNCLTTSIWWERFNGDVMTLCSPQFIKSDMSVGAVNLDCSVIDLQAGDKLYVNHVGLSCELTKKDLREKVQRWAGVDVEVILGNYVGSNRISRGHQD